MSKSKDKHKTKNFTKLCETNLSKIDEPMVSRHSISGLPSIGHMDRPSRRVVRRRGTQQRKHGQSLCAPRHRTHTLTG